MNRLGIFEEQAARKFLDRFMSDFERQLGESKAQTLLLSSEYLSAMTEIELKRLKKYLEDVAEKTCLFCYVRDPWSFSISWLQQNLRDGFWKGAVRPSYFRGNVEIVDQFAETFGVKPTVRPYVAIDRRPLDVIDDFLRYLGISDRRDLVKTIPGRGNTAMGWTAACIVSRINELYPSVDASGHLAENPARDWVVEKVIESCQNDVPIRMSRQTAREIRLSAEQDLRRLHEVYLGGEDVYFRAYDGAAFDEVDDLISIDRLDRADLLQALLRAQIAQAQGGIRTWKQAEQDIAERDSHIAVLLRVIGERERHIALLLREIGEHKEQIDAMQATKSWQVTRPLRAIYRLLRG
jgi:hypothetical protein